MKSKSDRLNRSANGDSYKFSIDSCNHSTSTSLRDLKDEYRILSREKVENKRSMNIDQSKK